MILAFLAGGILQFFLGNWYKAKTPTSVQKGRSVFYQIVVIYLLFKIGFKGGASMLSESLDHVLFTSFIAVIISVIWTILLLRVLKRWSPFDRLTQISVATHFGSVSVGTFIAALEFLGALGVETSSSVVIWLAIMELPALFVGVFALKIKFSKMLQILKKDTMLWVLVGAILFGIFGSKLITESVNTFLFSTIFLPVLGYFLFEMGSKASESLQNIKGQLKSLLLFGTGIPLVGGTIGACIAVLLNYSLGEAFLFSILMASASYVLVPISLREILHNASVASPQKVQNAIATSMALSVGITLPFNIILGFEVYYWLIKLLATF